MRATASVALEVLQVGGATCLFRPENQATSLVNATAAAIVAELASGRAVSAIAGELALRHAIPAASAIEHVVRLHEDSHRCGLLGALARPVAPPADMQVPPVRPRHARHYAIGAGRSARICVEDLDLRALIEAALAPIASDCRSGETSIVVGTTGHARYNVLVDGLAVVRDADLALARRAILQSTLMAVQPRDRVAAIVHASAIAIQDRAAVLAGATGSGKTTLMLALLAEGACYIADDFTPLGPDGKDLMSFPVAASVKSGSWSILAGAFPQIGRASTFTLGARRVRYLDLTGRRCTANARAAAIVCPRFEPGAATRLERLRPEEALRALVDCGAEPVGRNPSMRSLVSLATHCPAWSLTYSDTQAAVACVTELLEPR